MSTIVEAIKIVLSDFPEGLTSKEIYNEIINRDLYTFNAINPHAIVNGMVRRHCYGLNFPTSSPHKYFQINSNQNKKCKYTLFDEATLTEESKVKKINLKSEVLPEEKMQEAYNEHITLLKTQLLNFIINASPQFFEELVVELLVKMGYGYDKDSSQVTRYNKDGGVDGIIEEDRLGLDKIYIQAKRYSIGNNVQTKDVYQFASVMGKMNVKKGVFITTSSFASTAQKEFSGPFDGKTIRLIDGNDLMDYLIRYEIGVKNVMTYKTFVLDENYFDVI